MTNLDTRRAADITPVTTISDTEAQIDMQRMRTYRLGRVREQLVKNDIAACVLFSPLSIRYATGLRNCALSQTHIVSGYVFIPAQGPVISFDVDAGHRVAEHLETIDECRPSMPLSYMFAGARMDEWMRRWAEEMASLVAEHGAGNRRLAIERAGTRGPLAF
ncbi:MAG: aminopeptidase P family N-terminal domain-containing protein, partial [Gammaproteobacteria bacterium]|nr:aminopeptidase P family N-terminal domain-containing protein [Gammaproteobacteria bacterium]